MTTWVKAASLKVPALGAALVLVVAGVVYGAWRLVDSVFRAASASTSDPANGTSLANTGAAFTLLLSISVAAGVLYIIMGVIRRRDE